MRRETKAMQNIKRMYGGLNIDREAVAHKAKLLLKVYRDVAWVYICETDGVFKEVNELYSSTDPRDALTYLSDFAPIERHEDFVERVTNLFETKWLIGLIDRAMLRVYNYPHNGKLYHDILAKCYTTRFPLSEYELLENFNLERSALYERKREATMLIGIALWGFAIPELKFIFKEYGECWREIGHTYFTGITSIISADSR